MHPVARAQKAAIKFEKTLADHADALARAIDRPAAARDEAEVNLCLMQMNGLRTHLRREFRSYERAERKKTDGFDPKSDPEHGRLQRYFLGVRWRLRQWDRIVATVEALLLEPHDTLYPEPPGDNVVFQRLDRAMEAMGHALHRLANPTVAADDMDEIGYFPDIPLHPQTFLAEIHAAYRLCLALGKSRPLRFIDVGCGGGTKLLLAAQYFDQVTGLEYAPDYAAAGRAFVQLAQVPRAEVVEGDALEYDGYDGFDVIYFYRPIRTEALMRALETRIIEMARPGTVLVAPYNPFYETLPRAGVAHVQGRLSVTGIDAAEADRLRAVAAATGTDVAPPEHGPDSRAGFWAPVIEACAAQGWTGGGALYRPFRYRG